MNATVIWRACKFVGLGVALALGFLSSQGQLELKEVEVCPQGPPKCFSASIQVAVNAVAPGGLVSVAPGEYKENVTIQKSLILRGEVYEGWRYGEGAILNAQDPEQPTLAIKSSQVTIEHLVVRGGMPIPIREGVIEVERGSQAVYIRQSRIESEGAAIVATRSRQLRIEENIILTPPRESSPGTRAGAGEAISVANSKEILILRNTILADATAITIMGGDQIEVVGNYIGAYSLSALHSGIIIVPWPPPLILFPPLWPLWEEAEGMGSAQVADNILIGPGYNGIAIVGRKLEMTNNHLLGFWMVGIEALSEEALTIQGNTVAVAGVSEIREAQEDYYGRGVGILAYGIEGSVLHLEGNVVKGNARFGILVGTQRSGRAHLSGNAVIRSERGGIALLQEPCVTEVAGSFIRIYLPYTFNLRFEGELSGEGNFILGAGKDELCPADFPWPAGFKK